ncbi:hypothetical protein GCM10027162_32870 [Streptomyces incanus]
MDGAVVREVVREVFPGDSRAVDVEERVEHVAQFDLGRPVGLRSSRALLQAVSVGSIRAHRASDRSLGYGFRSLTAQREHEHAGGFGSAGCRAVLHHFQTGRISEGESG